MIESKDSEMKWRDVRKIRSGALALVIAPQGRLSDGWRALLLATPQIAQVRQLYDAASVRERVETLGPDLVLLDAESLDQEAWAVLNQIKDACVRCCCIVLICSARYRQQALDAGADEVLLKGFHAGELSAAVQHLLSGKEQGRKES
jgi:DNA-binding response OmpR family regulator